MSEFHLVEAKNESTKHRSLILNILIQLPIWFPVIFAHNFSCGVSAKQQLGVDSKPAAAC